MSSLLKHLLKILAKIFVLERLLKVDLQDGIYLAKIVFAMLEPIIIHILAVDKLTAHQKVLNTLLKIRISVNVKNLKSGILKRKSAWLIAHHSQFLIRWVT